jgi:hypothetical protein
MVAYEIYVIYGIIQNVHKAIKDFSYLLHNIAREKK